MPNEEENIFQAAAGKKPTGKKSKASKKPLTPDPEIQAMLKRMQDIRVQFKEAFDVLAKQHGMTAEQFNEWLNNFNNLTPENAEYTVRTENELKKKLAIAISQDPKKLRKTEAEVNKDDQNRKSKTLGSRKNWIPIR